MNFLGHFGAGQQKSVHHFENLELRLPVPKKALFSSFKFTSHAHSPEKSLLPDHANSVSTRDHLTKSGDGWGVQFVTNCLLLLIHVFI